MADLWNDRLQLLSAGGEWAVVPGVEVKYPTDVIIVNDRMWLLHGGKADELAQYKM